MYIAHFFPSLWVFLSSYFPFFYLPSLFVSSLMYITSSGFFSFLLSLTLSLPFTLFFSPLCLPCNLICFSFIHPLHRHCNERLIEVESLFGRLPLSLSLELIAVLQSVWFDFIGAIWFSNVTFRVWLKPRHKPNWEMSSSSCRCHSHTTENKDLAAFYCSVFLPLINVFASQAWHQILLSFSFYFHESTISRIFPQWKICFDAVAQWLTLEPLGASGLSSSKNIAEVTKPESIRSYLASQQHLPRDLSSWSKATYWLSLRLQ